MARFKNKNFKRIITAGAIVLPLLVLALMLTSMSERKTIGQKAADDRNEVVCCSGKSEEDQQSHSNPYTKTTRIDCYNHSGKAVDPVNCSCRCDGFRILYKGMQDIYNSTTLYKGVNYRVFVKGTKVIYSITKMRLKVNDAVGSWCSSVVDGWCESRNAKPPGNYYIDYTVPTDATSVELKAQVYCNEWSADCIKTFTTK